MEQCGMVGVNWTRTEGRLPFRTVICSDETTASCSSVSGCSGSEMERMRSGEGQGGSQFLRIWNAFRGRHSGRWKLTKDLVRVNLVRCRCCCPALLVLAERSVLTFLFEPVGFVRERAAEAVPSEVVVCRQVEVGDSHAPRRGSRRRVHRRVRIVHRRIHHGCWACTGAIEWKEARLLC